MSAATPAARTASIFGLLEPFQYGRGRARPIPLPSPAAGAAPATVKVPGSAYWHVKTVTLQLVTSATVANRLVAIDYRDADGVILFRHPAPVVQIAGLTTRYSWGLNYPAGLSPAGAFTAPLCGLFLEPGYQVVFTVTAIDATDAVTGVALVVDELFTGDGGYDVGADVAGRGVIPSEEG